MKTIIQIFLFTIIITACQTNNNDANKDNFQKHKSTTLSFREWAENMPNGIFKLDTITSELKFSTKKYDTSYIPNGAELIGNWIQISGDSGYHTYILYKYLIKGAEIPYLEVYDQNGIRNFRKSTVDQNFTLKSKNNHSRCYIVDTTFVFENYTVEKNKETIVKRNVYSFYELFEKDSH